MASQFNLTTAIFRAQYDPSGADLALFKPVASAELVVEVRYLDAQMTLTLDSMSVHVAQPFSIVGELLGTNGSPLAGRMIGLWVDRLSVGNFTTDPSGKISIQYAFNPGTSIGPHELTVVFIPINDLYQIKSSTLTVELSYYDSSIHPETPQGWFLSGQSVEITGIVQSTRGAIDNGTVIALVGGRQVSAGSVGSDGRFALMFTVPLETAASTDVVLVYEPVAPWVIRSTTTLQLPLTNSLAIIGGALALSLVGFAVYKSPTRIILTAKSALRRPVTKKAEVPSEDIHRLPRRKLVLNVAALRARKKPDAIVKATYWTIRDIIASNTGIPDERAVTHREFYEHVKGHLMGREGSLQRVTSRFEAAEYAEKEVSEQDGVAVIHEAIVLAEAVEGRIEE
jgi:hypothetical protein